MGQGRRAGHDTGRLYVSVTDENSGPECDLRAIATLPGDAPEGTGRRGGPPLGSLPGAGLLLPCILIKPRSECRSQRIDKQPDSIL